MNQQFRFGHFNYLPPVVKNLLIINGLFFVATFLLGGKFGIDLTRYLGLHYWTSHFFMPHQIVTHMFMHGGLAHIFSNMFALWMFGSVLENVWGPKRFLLYYLVTGIGAAVIFNLTKMYDVWHLSQALSPEGLELVKNEGWKAWEEGKNFTDPALAKLNATLNGPVVGASGAVFGVLLAFGMLFPNTYIYLYFAIPIKAKYFVMGYGAIELFLGIQNNPGDNVAHFAHLGGMLIGYFMIRYWNKRNRNTFY